jgi:hypothetical protein
MSPNVSVYAMFCGTEWSKIWESEVQRVNRIYCVMCPDEVRGECNGVCSDSEASHFLSLLCFCREILSLFENLFFSFLFFQEGLGVN